MDIKKKYNIIYAAPPWHFQNWNNASAQTNPEQHYSTMSMKDIENLPVGDSEYEADKKVRLVQTDICHDAEQIDTHYGAYTQAGYEGQMIRQDTAYENKRSKNLLKRKEFITEEYQVVEVHEGQGNWAGYAKILTLKMPNGTTFSSGIRGSQAKLKELLENPNIDWATCRYFELSNDGVPRFPVTIDYGQGVRND